MGSFFWHTAVGPFAGTLADRINQRSLMVMCDLGQAALFAGIAFLLPPFPVLLALVLVTSMLTTFFTPAGRGALPALVSADDLTSANALLDAGFNLSFALGPALGGFILAFINIRGALIIDLLTFVLSAALLLRLPSLLLQSSPSEEADESFLHATKTGFAYLVRHAVARAVVLSMFLIVLFVSVDNVALVFLAQRSLGLGDTGYGLLVSLYGVGLILASFLILRWKARLPSVTLFLVGILLDGIGTLLTGFAPFLLIALLTQCLAGVGNGFANVGNSTLLQQTVPRSMLGRVFGILSSSTYIAYSIAYVVGGPLLTMLSPRAVFVLAGGACIAVFLLIWMMLSRSTLSEASPPSS
jgi:MFS family permease